ncbi:hypothetical protein WJX74_009037 [Apatococcus lobatus]|uniref:Uncharacterized protein n=2 Tax=Apatococcus TaxID=904362 RepID=A0AAW1RNJ7_9CHLO
MGQCQHMMLKYQLPGTCVLVTLGDRDPKAYITRGTTLGTYCSRELQPAPGASSQIITAILGHGVPVVSIGSNTTQPDPVSDVPGLAPASTPRAAASASQILFTCRAIGQQIYTAGPTGQYNQTGAQADFWCGPNADAKISIKHYFSARQPDGSLREVFSGGSPTFEAADGTGFVVGAALNRTDSPKRANDGGFGSIPDLLLRKTETRGTFSDVTFVVRNNNLGGVVPSNYTPLAITSLAAENFGPTGAEGRPNAPAFIPYQADYTFFTGSTQPSLLAGGYTATVPTAASTAPGMGSGR